METRASCGGTSTLHSRSREDDPGGEQEAFKCFFLDRGRVQISAPRKISPHHLLIFQPPGRGLTIRGHFEAGPVGVEPSEGPSTLSAASVGGI